MTLFRVVQPAPHSLLSVATRCVLTSRTAYVLCSLPPMSCAACTRMCCVTFFAVQAIYAESISYINKISGTSVTAQQLRLSRASESEAPVLSKGARILVLPPDDALQTREQGARAPFWVAELAVDEDVTLGVHAIPLLCHCCEPRTTCRAAHCACLCVGLSCLSVQITTALGLSQLPQQTSSPSTGLVSLTRTARSPTPSRASGACAARTPRGGFVHTRGQRRDAHARRMVSN